MALSHVKEVQEKQVRAVMLCHVPEGWGSVFWELPRGNHLFFPFGNIGRQMTWRKDTAIKVILATGGWKGWLLMAMIRTVISYTPLVGDFSALVLNEEAKFTLHLSVGDFFIRWQSGRLSQLKFLFTLFYVQALSSSPETCWPLSAACWELPSLLGKVQGKKNELGDPWLTWLGNFFFSWSPVKREQEKK